MAGEEGNDELLAQLDANPSLIPNAAGQLISQRCFGTNKRIVCSEHQGLEVKSDSSLPEV